MMEVDKQISLRATTPVTLNSRRRRKADTSQEKIIDWIECVDPKSKRKYYYNPSLKKSTWSRPMGIDARASHEILTQPRSQSHHPSSQSQTENCNIAKIHCRLLNVRDSSSSPSLQMLRSYSSISSEHSVPSLFSQRSKGFGPSGSNCDKLIRLDGNN
jgi:hypothetical protein